MRNNKTNVHTASSDSWGWTDTVPLLSLDVNKSIYQLNDVLGFLLLISAVSSEPLRQSKL